jgi:hypothetical protein
MFCTQFTMYVFSLFSISQPNNLLFLFFFSIFFCPIWHVWYNHSWARNIKNFALEKQNAVCKT